ncbi:MAG: DUF87 domain-containing protein, partial [Nanoarchaeota archaeon]|nr:DUF87 domain-containing protein [Nanoarchaeota archaeon]
MVYDIIIGRSAEDRKELGTKGAVHIGKHYVKMGQVTSLSNDVYMDVTRSHVVFICGKRGSGKSYSMGAIAEGIADLPEEINQNISVIMLDTMGIYWTMKYPNEKDKELLAQWGMKGKGLDVQIFTPYGYYDQLKKKGVPTDFPFSIQPSELTPSDWCLTFGIDINSAQGVFIDRIIHELMESIGNFSIEDIIKAIEKDAKVDQVTRDGAINRFLTAMGWGLFRKEGTKIEDLVKGGQITVLDVSCYAVTPGAE